MTQSLLSSWIYYLDSEEQYAEQAYQSFLSTLKREKKKKTKAMQDGILFESLVNQEVDGKHTEIANKKWKNAVEVISNICRGGMKQVPVSKEVIIDNTNFILYGICDYVKAGIIYDIKKVTRYSYGKYFKSPQHPMYFRLIPESRRFEYLIFDGDFVYKESYKRYDCEPIENIISRFISFIKQNGLWSIYQENWAMNDKRRAMIYYV